MPTHVTYDLPGHQGPGAGIEGSLLMMLTVHSHIRSAPAARNTVTICRQAATNTAGDVC